MQRMTDALSRMLNDPSTRLAMRSLGERETLATRQYQRAPQQRAQHEPQQQDDDEREEEEVAESEAQGNQAVRFGAICQDG